MKPRYSVKYLNASLMNAGEMNGHEAQCFLSHSGLVFGIGYPLDFQQHGSNGSWLFDPKTDKTTPIPGLDTHCFASNGRLVGRRSIPRQNLEEFVAYENSDFVKLAGSDALRDYEEAERVPLVLSVCKDDLVLAYTMNRTTQPERPLFWTPEKGLAKLHSLSEGNGSKPFLRTPDGHIIGRVKIVDKLQTAGSILFAYQLCYWDSVEGEQRLIELDGFETYACPTTIEIKDDTMVVVFTAKRKGEEDATNGIAELCLSTFSWNWIREVNNIDTPAQIVSIYGNGTLINRGYRPQYQSFDNTECDALASLLDIQTTKANVTADTLLQDDFRGQFLLMGTKKSEDNSYPNILLSPIQ